MTIDVYALNDDVATEHRMNLPHRRVLNRDAFDQDVLAAIRLNKLWPEIVALAEDAFAHGHAFFRHREECRSIRALVAHAFFPAVLWPTVPWPPMLVVALAVKRAFAGDGDVLLLK